jgi:hypothetical protein
MDMDKNQGGWTLLGLLMVLGLAMFFAYIVMKVVPIYMDNEEVKHAMEVGIAQGDPKTMSRNTVIKNMYNQMVVDDTDNLTDWKKAVTYVKTRDKIVFTIKYNRVVPLFNDISLLIDFNNVMEIPTT